MYKPLHIDEEGLHCLECGGAIIGRTDKKFCNLQCRNAYHSHQRSEYRRRRRATILELSSNYAILDNMLRINKSSCPLDSLISLGFRPDLVTHIGPKTGGHLEYRCFDIAYCLTARKLFRLHRL